MWRKRENTRVCKVSRPSAPHRYMPRSTRRSARAIAAGCRLRIYGLVGGLLTGVTLFVAGCGPATTGSPVIARAPSTIVSGANGDFTAARALQDSGHCDRAIPLYLRAINSGGATVNAYTSLAGCYETLNDPNAALIQYDRAIAGDTGNFGLYITRGDIEFNLGNSGQAIADQLIAMQLATKIPASYETIAQHLSSYADFADAITAMDKAVALAPENPSLYEERGGYYAIAKEYSKAFADYQRALKVAPFIGARAKVDSDLAIVYAGEGDYNSAFGAIAEALRLAPDNEAYYLQSGNIHRDDSKLTAALALYDQSLRLAGTGPDAESAHESKGDIYTSLGQTKNAVVEYSQAEQLISRTDPSYKARIQGLRVKIKAAQNRQP